MNGTDPRQVRFLGTYFDHDAVLRVTRWAEVLAWVVVIVYATDFLVAVLSFALQYARGFLVGMGFTDLMTNILFLLERPFRGIVYFIALQAIAKSLLILMDMEDNLRHAGRK